MAERARPAAEQDKYILRLPDGMRDALKEMAAFNKRSMNAEIVARLEDYEAIRGDDIKWLKAEMSRLRKERDEAEARLKSRAGLELEAALAAGLPKGLYSRIAAAAAANDRPILEELVQALEAAFPPPPSFSLEDFFDEWAYAIIQEQDPQRKAELVAAANAVLRENGDEYEVWLDDRGSDSPKFAFGPKGSREAEEAARKKRENWGRF